MEEYTIDDVMEDLEALEDGDLDGEERVACVSRVRGFLDELNEQVLRVKDAAILVEESS